MGPGKRGQEGFLPKSLFLPDHMGRDIELPKIPDMTKFMEKKKILRDLPKVTAAEIKA